jgi:hypothetical protein
MKNFFIFISMPMNGLSTEEIKENTKKYKQQAILAATRYLENHGVTKMPAVHVADSYHKDPVPEFIKSQGLYCLGWSFQVLSGCDLAYFVPGWETARGCKMEHEAALAYGIPIYEEVENDVKDTK